MAPTRATSQTPNCRTRAVAQGCFATLRRDAARTAQAASAFAWVARYRVRRRAPATAPLVCVHVVAVWRPLSSRTALGWSVARVGRLTTLAADRDLPVRFTTCVAAAGCHRVTVTPSARGPSDARPAFASALARAAGAPAQRPRASIRRVISAVLHQSRANFVPAYCRAQQSHSVVPPSEPIPR
jgi:hypothetical protein